MNVVLVNVVALSDTMTSGSPRYKNDLLSDSMVTADVEVFVA